MKKRVYVFLLSLTFLAVSVSAQKVTIRQIGKNNLLFEALVMYPQNGWLYYVDNLGTINRTSLDSGVNSRLAATTYRHVNEMFIYSGKIYILESDGTMNEIDPVTGKWKALTAMGVWTKVDDIVIVKNILYSIQNGSLFRHRSINVDDRTSLGEPEFYNVGMLIYGNYSLYTLFKDGSLFEVNTSNGGWKAIGKKKTWKGYKTVEVVNDKIYSIDQGGNFSMALATDGVKNVLDKEQFTKARWLFEDGGKLYCVMDGNLYEVIVE